MSNRSDKKRCLARALSTPAPRVRDVAIVATVLAILVFLPSHGPARSPGASEDARITIDCLLGETTPVASLSRSDATGVR